MRISSLVAACLVAATLPLGASAKQLGEAQLRQLIRTCFQAIDTPAQQPFAVDLLKLQALGFALQKNTGSRLEAFRPNNAAAPSKRSGVLFQVSRHRKKQDELKYKSCKLDGTGFSALTANKANELLIAEAKKAGFQPVRNNKNKIVWVRGATVVRLDVLFRLAQGQAISEGYPTHIIVDGVHERNLP